MALPAELWHYRGTLRKDRTLSRVRLCRLKIGELEVGAFISLIGGGAVFSTHEHKLNGLNLVRDSAAEPVRVFAPRPGDEG